MHPIGYYSYENDAEAILRRKSVNLGNNAVNSLGISELTQLLEVLL